MHWREVFGFEDADLDRRFQALWLRTSLFQIRISIVLAAIISLAFAMLDRVYFDAETQSELVLFRVFVMVPWCIVAMVATLVERLQCFLFSICAAALVTFTAYFCSIALRQDLSVMSFVFPLLVQFALFLFILLRIPFRLAFYTSLACLALCAYTFMYMPGEGFHKMSYLSGMVAIFAILLINLFQRDLRERTLFINQLKLEESEKARRKIEQEKEQWYRNFASFLRHELNNQMVGVQSSLDMLERMPERKERYLSRANTSLASMRSMVNEAADATSIDAALQDGEQELCNIALILRETIHTYRESFPEQAFAAHAPDELWLYAQPFRIFQLLDKLLSNAMRHVREGTTIHAYLEHEDGQAVIRVEDEGDALPIDKKRMFELWHTGNAAKQQTRSGLGLYVVARIAAAHGGHAEAFDLDHATGASIVVSLPINLNAPNLR